MDWPRLAVPWGGPGPHLALGWPAGEQFGRTLLGGVFNIAAYSSPATSAVTFAASLPKDRVEKSTKSRGPLRWLLRCMAVSNAVTKASWCNGRARGSGQGSG